MEFRELVRIKKQIPKEECIRILKAELRGVLSLIGDGGYPYGMSLNHYYNEADGKLYFHSGKRDQRVRSRNFHVRPGSGTYQREISQRSLVKAVLLPLECQKNTTHGFQ